MTMVAYLIAAYLIAAAALDGRLDEIGREEGKRDRHIRFTDAALFPLRDALRSITTLLIDRRASCRRRAACTYLRSRFWRWPPRPSRRVAQ